MLEALRVKVKEPNDLFNAILSKVTKNDVFAIIIVFVLGIINNFTFVITEGVAPDALISSDFQIAGRWEISLGRFGLSIVNMLRFGLINKFLIIVISLLFLSISVIIIMRIFEVKNKIVIFFISALIAVAPQFTETYMFIYCADAYCLAFLLATLSVLLLKKAKNKWGYYILSAICTMMVCSLYQAYLGVVLGFTIILSIYYLLNNMKAKEILIQTLKNIGAIFIGILLYYILLKIIITILGISLSSYKGANSLGINTILSLPKTIMQTYKDFYNFFFTNKIINNTFWKREIINIIIFIISSIGILRIISKNKHVSILLIGFLLMLPIGINVMNLIAPDTTMNLATGSGMMTLIVLVAIIYYKLPNNLLNNIVKYGYILILCALIFTFLLENTFTYMCRQSTYENYNVITNDIYNKATELSDYSNDKEWMFSNVIKFRPKNYNKANGFISNDNETWNNYGGTVQNSNYFEKYLGIKIKICSKSKYAEIIKTDEFKEMPVYPNPGSIAVINDIIVIKVSDKTF